MQRLLERKEQIIDAIAGIRSMRRGTFNEVYRKRALKDGRVSVRGPFYNVTTKGKGNKTVTKAVTKKDAARVREEVEGYRRFRALCEEYADVCEGISLLSGDGGAA